MSSTTTPNTPNTAVRQIPQKIRNNAEARRVITSVVPAPPTKPDLVQVGVASVSNHSHEIFIQCLYMLPVVGNAMSLYDVGTDIYRICSVTGAAKNLFNWGILAVDAIGVVPAAGNASRPARAVVKEVLLAFAKGAVVGVLVDLFWATAGGDVIEFMSKLDEKLKAFKADIVKGVREASGTLRRFVKNPVSAAEQMSQVKKNTGFLSWVPTGEEIALHGIDELLEVSGKRDAILAWLDEFDRNTEPMLNKAFGDAATAGSLIFMAAQIVREIQARRAHKPSHVAQAAPGTMTEPHTKPGQHQETTQKGARPSETPAKNGCGCPSTASDKPVNYAMGDENLEQTDFALDGVVPIVWTRRYRSSLTAYDDSPLGARWSSPYHLSLEMKDGALVFFDPDNRAVPLPPVEVGESVDVPAEQMSVSRPDARRVRLAYPDGSHEDYERHGTTTLESRERFRLTARTARDGLGLTFSYNDAGELVTLSDRAENTIRLDYAGGRIASIQRVNSGSRQTETLASYTYSAEGDLIEHQDVLGHRRQFAYEQHLLVRYTDFNGHAANLEWDWLGKRSGIPAPADAKCVRTWIGNDEREVRDETRFEYHREHWYTKVTDAAGNATFHRYDAHNRIVLVEHSDGTSERFDWDENNNLTGIRDALGQMQRFGYDASGRVVAVTDALGNTTRTEYDAQGLPVMVTAANGDVTQTAYDPLGRPVSVTDAAGRTTRYSWSSAGRVLSLTDPKGGEKRFRYDSAGRLTEAVDCSGYATFYGYDERGHLAQRTDAERNVTTYRHDARGQLVQVTRPDGITEQFTWDGEGNLKSYRDGAGQLTEYSFNMRRQPITRQDAAGRRIGYSYDSQWRLERLRNENDEDTEFRYDALGQLIEQKDFDGRTTAYTYDEAGQLAGSREGDVETEFVRDPLGRLTQRNRRAPAVGTLNERFYYDARGRLVTAQSESSKVQLHYDDAGNLIAEEQHQHPSTEAEYVTVTRHEYDALGNRTKTVLPNTRTIDWLRYGSGHVHGVLVDGQPLVDFERDRLHRETGRTHTAFSQQRDYDPAGRLARLVVKPDSAAGPHERIAERRLQYSAAGHLTRIEDRTRGATDYTYDPVGRLLKSVTPDLTEIFAFDPAGNPVDPEKMTPPPVVETPQEKAERFARESAEDAAWLRAHPDEQYPPLRHNKRGSEDAAKLYEWKRSLPKCIGNVLDGLNRTRYDYDARGNLSRRVEPDGQTWLYRYDAANRLRQASRFAREPAANELDRTEPLENGVRYLNGTARAELVVSFRYDVFGRRTLKEVERAGGGIDRTVFTWDGDVLLMEERFHEPLRRAGELRSYRFRSARVVREVADDPYSLPVAQRVHTMYEGNQWQGASIYLHEPDSFVPLARLDETMVEPAHLATGTDGRFVQMPATTRHATLFYQNDHLGTPQELLDESGKVVWLARYKAWGGGKEGSWKERPDAVEAANAVRFQGQYRDEETGLHYNRYRYYDPGSGRFISKDPIGLAGGINVYQYAPNPVQWIDPLGLDRITNAVEGARREDVFNAQMRARYPNATVQCQCYLRNAQGKSVKDPDTNERRRIDTAVIENGRAQTYEVTSMTADKTAQLAKEGSVLQNGGAYIRDRSTGSLVPVNGVSELVRLP
jgi:RHS repeat-associated protein